MFPFCFTMSTRLTPSCSDDFKEMFEQLHYQSLYPHAHTFCTITQEPVGLCFHSILTLRSHSQHFSWCWTCESKLIQRSVEESILRPDVEASGFKTRAGIGPRAAAIPLAAVPKMLAHHLAQHLPWCRNDSGAGHCSSGACMAYRHLGWAYGISGQSRSKQGCRWLKHSHIHRISEYS